MDGSCRYRCAEHIFTAEIMIVHLGASHVSRILVFHFKHVRKSSFLSVWISLYVLSHLYPCVEALIPVEKHKVRTENVDVRSGSHRTPHETLRFLNDLLQKYIRGEACLTAYNVSVLGVRNYHAHLFGHSTARFQLTQVIKLI